MGFLSTYNGDLRDPIMLPQENQVSMRVMSGLLGFLSIRCWVLGPHLELRPEPQVSSPVLTWISGFLWSFQGSQASSRVEICKSPFVSSFNSSVRLPAELTQGSVSFSQGATGLSHWPWCFESILRVTVESVQWNQFYQGWTGTWGSFEMVKRPLEFLLTFKWRPLPLELPQKRRDSFPDEAGNRTLIMR